MPNFATEINAEIAPYLAKDDLVSWSEAPWRGEPLMYTHIELDDTATSKTVVFLLRTLFKAKTLVDVLRQKNEEPLCFPDLPTEIYEDIVQHLGKYDLLSLCGASLKLNGIGTRALYTRIKFPMGGSEWLTANRVLLLLQTLKKITALADLPRRLELDWRRRRGDIYVRQAYLLRDRHSGI
ncbi:hypothetical protein AURDEDRAFT_156551 [Auricularia subglabra TFB-10046 SS5]|nr:hypothetical protein AURDEDRAFT_156551 [Auricularia subglabra TFB-10046 SS5]